jgi:hypothetical protein
MGDDDQDRQDEKNKGVDEGGTDQGKALDGFRSQKGISSGPAMRNGGDPSAATVIAALQA